MKELNRGNEVNNEDLYGHAAAREDASSVAYQANTPIQHGENVLVPIAHLPEGEAKLVKTIIAGHSETGHHHVLTSTQGMKVVEIGDRMYIENAFEALLTHKKASDKHDTLTVRPGIWEVKHKTEYNPITKVLSRVFD